MSQSSFSSEAVNQRPQPYTTPFIADHMIIAADKYLSSDDRIRMRTMATDGDQVGLYFGNRIAQLDILIQEKAASRIAREQPQLYASLAVTAVIRYNKA